MAVPAITERLERLISLGKSKNENGEPDSATEEQPLRAELFSVEQLERHAATLAESHELATGSAPDKLIPRLDENQRVLVHAYDLIVAAVTKNRRIAPAAEWLLANFYLFDDQIRTARRHLPPSYGRELPRLASGAAATFPRVYGIALELISHVDGRLDVASLNRFIASYQTLKPLKLGELWAVPIMLRLALIENLRRVAARVAEGRQARDAAADWAERMVLVVEQNPSDLILVLADMARASPRLSGAFLADLTRHLHGQSAHFTLVTTWLEHRLAEEGLNIEQLVQSEGQTQAADQVSIGNSINSLRFLSSTDWREFVESHSVVDQILRDDPAHLYGDMDFVTRDHYRHAVEQIAKRSRMSEGEVARKAIELASAGSTDGARTSHVGYYLIHHGRAALERLAGMRTSLRTAAAKIRRRYPLPLFLSVVLATTAVVITLFLEWSARRGVTVGLLALLALPVLLCAAHLGVGVANWLTTLFVKPRPLPRMDFSDGIPAKHHTIVVIPTILSGAEQVGELVEGLEIRYLANRDDHLDFALLTDLKDAPQEVMPEDEELVRLAREGVEQLNQKYEGHRSDIFFLFHRTRRWNPQEGLWMGYERKRGKLGDFNAAIRGSFLPFSKVIGDTAALQKARYVITLDTDTQLPRDSAREMVGTMAHTLNRPVFDPERTRVVEGYGILQPRVGASLPSSQRSWFTRLFAGDAGVDPYTRLVSDVYQDLFGEGSFIGKGIYDVDSFEQTCGRFPENAILSHDLLESAFARSAVLSDVELYEEYPSRYPTDVSRRHRWMRGDWQIARWLLPWVPAANGQRVRNPISALSWWKIFDNLRRSVVPVAMLVLLAGSWLLLPPPQAMVSTLFVLAIVAATPLLTVLGDLVRKPIDLSLLSHLRLTAMTAGRHAAHFAFALVFLPYDAFISADAIVRTLVRMLFTKRHLLEWKTSSEAELSTRQDLLSFFRSMWIAPAICAATILLASMLGRSLSWPALLLLSSWTISPLIAWWLSRPLVAQPVRLSDRQLQFLEKLSRQTWRYFEVFVTAEENWLPPDNFQEHPVPVVASRTSPTNIGMSLLANLAAYDFGYSSAAQLIDRTRKTFDTLGRMERHRGHFYNWYDTRSLKPLPPLYISTVDSGNLAGHLLVLRSGLLELVEKPVLPPRVFAGLRDTARVLLDAARGLHGQSNGQQRASVPPQVLSKIEQLTGELENPPRTLSASASFLARLKSVATEMRGLAPPDDDVKWWTAAFERSCADHRDDLLHLAAWIALPQWPQGTLTNAPPEQLRDLLSGLDDPPTLRTVAALEQSVLPLIDQILPNVENEGSADWIVRLRQAIATSSQRAVARIKALTRLADQCHDFADMEFSFLLEESRDLFSIGYNLDHQRLDNSFYDLLASEARLGSFVAIAQGQVGEDHWFALGRLLTATGGAPVLLSWSGSMFEYLMPLLVMPTYDKTLLEQTYKAAVRRQITYGKQHGVPWGISESGYNTIDLHMNYQYRAFGVPGLGLKRGLSEDLVVAPYASVLALIVAPHAAIRNLARLASDGMSGAYGFYEAVDYTPSRVPRGEQFAIVQQFMAHHQGMSFLSLAYLLLDRPMQRRFSADPMLRAADLLLHERVPKTSAPIFPHTADVDPTRAPSSDGQGTMRVFTDPSAPIPEVHLLSNGQYHVVVTSAGGGYSRWRDIAVTRWREDATRDCWGTFCYLRDLSTGAFWSTAYQPALTSAKPYEAVFTQARAEFRRRDSEIETHTEISVSPEDDIELRRTTIINRSESPRTIEVTSYAEVVLAPHANDLAHRAFSSLFVQTALVPHRMAILCTRRPRSADERPPWMLHLMTVRGTTIGKASFETDRMKFVGRNRTLAFPAAMETADRLSDSEGPVLDPMVGIRNTIHLQPHETAQVDLITGVAESQEAIVAMMDKYHDPRLADRVFELAWTHSYVLLRQLNVTEADAQVYGRLAGSIIYASPPRRAKATTITRNQRGQSGLWGYGISGDLPIVLVRIRSQTRLELIHQAVQAHAYWRMKGLSVDLVIWNEDDSVYRQALQDRIMNLIAGSPEAALVDKPGGIFVRRGEQMSEEDRTLLLTVARVVLRDEDGSLSEQVERKVRAEVSIALLKPRSRKPEPATAAEVPQRDLAFFNGLGGFSRDGREYITILSADQTTPAPWINVIANAQFGTIVSESGGGYTWSENSHEFRLTPWHNDAATDASGEAIYIRDEETGRFWSPAPLPARGCNPYVARHGFGYTFFEYAEDGIISELCLFVATDAPVKFARLRITNRSGRTRQLSVTGFWEWVLGELRDKSLMHVISELDPISGALFARNTYNTDFAGRVAFVDCSEPIRTVTADRTEFLGRNGTLANPAALLRVRLSGRVGAGMDPCAAMQVECSLKEGQERDIVFVLGAAQGEDKARQLAHRFRGTGSAQLALEGVWQYWSRTLGAVYVETPDPAVNFLANGWLMYQVLACRMWGRTGFYQSGGAFGFRDQLQDAMALVHAEPGLLREHLLRAAAHQFREGDVQHWWHPPTGRGVRTRMSDDYHWLPYATCRYVAATGDTGVLEERLPFLDARPVRMEEDSYFDLPRVSDDAGTLYEHCIRAINHGLRFGEHGLPLMGTGDWNDGMNLVGAQGRGESVWLAFFLCQVLTQFAELAQKRGDTGVAEKYTIEANRLRGNIELHGWDGDWYRRAYFDDGRPLGSAANPECQIDSISQSWSVLSGAGTRDRSLKAMNNVMERLVRINDNLVQLLDPPFDQSDLNPGYIKGYVPGVRENGGQYTHAAIWTVMAFAAMGDSQRAWKLFFLINPIRHAASPEAIQKYRVEPYVVAADVYASSPHIGRGGWTWYTGSAGWMYRLITESLLGLRLEVDKLRLAPRIPTEWTSFKIHYRYRDTTYHISVRNGGSGSTVKKLLMDGTELPQRVIPLIDDRKHHDVDVQLE